MKRLISALLCLSLLFCLPPVGVHAAETAISTVPLSLTGLPFDEQGKLLPQGKLSELRADAQCEGVSARIVTWYQAGVPLAQGEAALQPYTPYQLCLCLEAEEGFVLTQDSCAELFGESLPLQALSPEGTRAFLLSPEFMTACAHKGSQYHRDTQSHWQVCSHCHENFGQSQHLWVEGETVGDKITYTCSVCGASKAERTGLQLLYKASLTPTPAVIGATIQAPTLADDSFRIVSYQWFRGGTQSANQVEVGSTFEADEYYLSITLRVRDVSRHYITAGSYISTDGAYQETACTVDADAAAITALFAVPVYPTASAQITLPELTAGSSLSEALQALAITSPGLRPTPLSCLVYENGAFLALAGVNAEGEFVWTGEDGIVSPGNSYTLLGSAAFEGVYFDTKDLRVSNPQVCHSLSLQGGAQSVGFRAQYLCTSPAALPILVLSGAQAPVGEDSPALPAALNSKQPELYTARALSWQEGERLLSGKDKFELGKTYQLTLALTLKTELDTDQLPALPLILDGQLAQFKGAGENGSFLYTLPYLCETALPHTHEWDEGLITREPTESEAGVRTYTCLGCGETKTQPEPPLAHTHRYEAAVTAPTCTKGGYTTFTCPGCGSSYQDALTPALGHAYEAQVTAPDCTQAGCTTHSCTRCGDSYEDSPVPATGHSWDEGVVTKEPTEHAEGLKTFTCTACKERKTEPIGKLPHSYTPTVTAPTCTRDGYTTFTCACGDSYRSEEIPALGHAYEAGLCSRCGAYNYDYVCDGGEACPGLGLSDLPPAADWSHKGIDFCLQMGLMEGTGQNLFSPKRPLTRAQLVTILYRMEGEPEVEHPSAFVDVERNTWYTDPIAWAAAAQIVDGVGGDRFLPQGNITREQLCTIARRYAQHVGADTQARDSLSAFPDADKVSPWAKDSVQWAVAAGILTGKASGDTTRLLPQGQATRAECAAILMRLYQLLPY